MGGRVAMPRLLVLVMCFSLTVAARVRAWTSISAAAGLETPGLASRVDRTLYERLADQFKSETQQTTANIVETEQKSNDTSVMEKLSSIRFDIAQAADVRKYLEAALDNIGVHRLNNSTAAEGTADLQTVLIPKGDVTLEDGTVVSDNTTVSKWDYLMSLVANNQSEAVRDEIYRTMNYMISDKKSHRDLSKAIGTMLPDVNASIDKDTMDFQLKSALKYAKTVASMAGGYAHTAGGAVLQQIQIPAMPDMSLPAMPAMPAMPALPSLSSMGAAVGLESNGTATGGDAAKDAHELHDPVAHLQAETAANTAEPEPAAVDAPDSTAPTPVEQALEAPSEQTNALRAMSQLTDSLAEAINNGAIALDGLTKSGVDMLTEKIATLAMQAPPNPDKKEEATVATPATPLPAEEAHPPVTQPSMLTGGMAGGMAGEMFDYVMGTSSTSKSKAISAISSDAWTVSIDTDTDTKFIAMKKQKHTLRESKFGEKPLVPRKKKRCVFLHGAGSVLTGPPVDHYEDYWGKITEHTPQCSERIFGVENTVDQTWHDPNLYERYCQIAVGDRKDRTIRDTIVFTHSAGTITLGAGIESGACDFDPLTSSWYAIGYHPPSLHNLTTGASTFALVNSSVMEGVSSQLSLYVENAHYTYPDGRIRRMYACLAERPDCANKPTLNKRQDVERTIRSRVSGSMCGCSSRGLGGKYSYELQAIAWLWASGPNDGVVPCDACMRVGTGRYGESYTNPHYAALANHADIACVNPDGDTDDSKPCQWYSLAT